MWRFQINKKILKKSFFLPTANFQPKNTFFLNQNCWRYEILVKTKKFRLDGTILKNKKNSKKVIFSAYRKLLAEKHVFFKSKPLKIRNFGKNQEVSSWCDDFKKQVKSEKVIFSAYGKLLAENTFFFKSKLLKIINFGKKPRSFVFMWRL